MSLFTCSPADVTLERVRELVGQDLSESLTLEYKEKYSPSLVKSVAAMANSYGGLILVGVTDQDGPGRLAGVPGQALVQIVNACYEQLEAPWEPEIVPVPLTAESGGRCTPPASQDVIAWNRSAVAGAAFAGNVVVQCR